MVGASKIGLTGPKLLQVTSLLDREASPLGGCGSEQFSNRPAVDTFAAAEGSLKLKPADIEKPLQGVEAWRDQTLFDSRDGCLRHPSPTAQFALAEVGPSTCELKNACRVHDLYYSI
jgi:hypothetical protein